MRRPSTDGGVEGVNDRAAPRGTRSKVVALGARRARGQSLPGADLELATFLHPLRGPDGPIGTLAAAKKVPWQCTGDQEIVLKLLAHAASVAVQLGRSRTTPTLLDGLAGTQRTIARLLIADKTHKQIAQATGLSSRTVGHYVERLKLRCGASTMHGLVGSLLRGTR